MNDTDTNQIWATQQSKLDDKDAAIKRLQDELIRIQTQRLLSPSPLMEVIAGIPEKDAEIARLKHLAEERLDRLKMEMQTTRLLKALCVRAADALEEEFGPGNTDLMTKDPWALIAELRKAE